MEQGFFEDGRRRFGFGRGRREDEERPGGLGPDATETGPAGDEREAGREEERVIDLVDGDRCGVDGGRGPRLDDPECSRIDESEDGRKDPDRVKRGLVVRDGDDEVLDEQSDETRVAGDGPDEGREERRRKRAVVGVSSEREVVDPVA